MNCFLLANPLKRVDEVGRLPFNATQKDVSDFFAEFGAWGPNLPVPLVGPKDSHAARFSFVFFFGGGWGHGHR